MPSVFEVYTFSSFTKTYISDIENFLNSYKI